MILSSAENNVYQYLLKGYTNQEIADQLFVCEKTIKFHLTSIFKKLEVHSRQEAIAKHYRQEEKPIREAFMIGEKKLEQGARAIVVTSKSQEDKIQFIDDKFKVGNTITKLHEMMTEVTKEEINPATVNAACNCVARLNETINTAIMAAKFLNER